MILFFLKLSLNKLANNLFELKASDPPLKIEQLPDFKHNAATSAVTLGLLSYITPITPIGVVTFFIATTSWISSLAINVSPFMRFDGYYVFGDWLKAENLQPRSFALAKWRLRELLFGFNHQPPEELNPSRRWTFITYAWFTWTYRFFIFTR